MIEYLNDMLKLAAKEVFSTMLNMNVEFQGSNLVQLNGEMHVAGAVGFTGQFNGMVYLYTSAVFAREITSSLLGIPAHDIDSDEMVNDAVGELTNMLAGMIKSRLCDKGVTCVISIPAVVRGQSFRIDSVSSTEKHTVFFKYGKYIAMAEIMVKPA